MKKQILNDIKNIYLKNNYISEKFYYKYGKFSKKDISEHFKTFKNAIQIMNDNNLNINFNTIDKDILKEDILNVFNRFNYIDHKLYMNYGKYNYNYIIDHFGSFYKMRKELNLISKKYTERTKEEILKLGIDYFNENGYLKKNEFLKNKKIAHVNFNSEFENFNEFINLLGIKNKLKSVKSNKISNKLNGNSNYNYKIDISKDEFDKTALEIYKNKGTNNFCDKYFYEKSGFTPNYTSKFYKNFADMKKQLNLYSNKELFLLDRTILDDHLLELYSEYGKLTRDLIKSKSPYGYKLIIGIYGGHQEMLNKLKIKTLPTQVRGVTTNELLDDLLNLYTTHNSLSKDIIENYGNYNYRLYYTKLGNIDKIHQYLGLINQTTSICISNIGLYCINLFAEILQEEPIIEKTFDWLVNPETGYKLKLDGYFPKHNIAIEYDGIQHYEYIPHYHKDYNNFLKLQERDNVKDKLCKENGIKLIRIKHDESLNLEYLKSRL